MAPQDPIFRPIHPGDTRLARRERGRSQLGGEGENASRCLLEALVPGLQIPGSLEKLLTASR
eukprot:2289535-Pyramimonas_sp.AAC.1